MTLTVGVLALQGGVIEHLDLLHRAAAELAAGQSDAFEFIEVRTEEQLGRADALIIPGGESTTMAIVSARLGLLEPLRKYVKVDRKLVWGTCAGLIMLAEEASASKKGGQDLIGGLDVKVLRNRYGTQTESFIGQLSLPFLSPEAQSVVPFRGVFIRAPVVENVLDASGEKEPVEVLGVYKKPTASAEDTGDIVAVRQRNVFGTSFHPELTDDTRIHIWWLKQVLAAKKGENGSA